MIEILHAQPKPDINKYRIAGILYPLDERLPAVSSHFMASDLAVFHYPVSRTAELIFKLHCACLQTCRRRNDLKSRSRLIGIVDASVPPHLVQRILLFIIRHILAVFACIQGKRIVQIKLRDIDHGKDLSVLRIHQQDPYFFRLLFFHHLLRHLLRVHLDIIIQADLQRIACLRLQPVLRNAFQFNPSCVRRSQYGAVHPFQIFFILYLQSDDPLVISSGEPQDLRRKFIVRIISLEVFVHFHSVKLHIADRITGRLLYIRLNTLHRGHFLYPSAYGILIHLKRFRQRLYHLLRFSDLTVDHRYRTYCLICRQYLSLCVQDLSSRRLDVPLPLM